MSLSLQNAYHQVLRGGTLAETEMQDVIGELMTGESEPHQTAGFLSVLAYRGETVDEICGAARVMRNKCTSIRESGSGLLDTCGTGGDGLKTFNISTTAAILCAAAGVKIAKHGNRSVSSSSGSADVLESLGIKIDLTPEQVDECIEQVGIGFCFAPLLHQAMKHVVPIRKALKTRTIFNLLGPLTNPAHAEFQMIGTIRNEWAAKLAHALAKLGTTRAIVVCGNDELDEVCLWGPTKAYVVDQAEISEQNWTPADFDLPDCSIGDIQVDSAETSAKMIESIFAGEQTAARHIAIANAAAALWTVGEAANLKQAASRIAETIDSGTAREKLNELAEKTRSF